MRRGFKRASVEATEAGGEVAAPEAGEGPERWTSGRKADVVLRLLRGEELATVSREIGVPAHQIEEWRRGFVEGGKGQLRSRGEPDQETELARARAQRGELVMGV